MALSLWSEKLTEEEIARTKELAAKLNGHYFSQVYVDYHASHLFSVRKEEEFFFIADANQLICNSEVLNPAALMVSISMIHLMGDISYFV